jgi:hypothetical protein
MEYAWKKCENQKGILKEIGVKGSQSMEDSLCIVASYLHLAWRSRKEKLDGISRLDHRIISL